MIFKYIEHIILEMYLVLFMYECYGEMHVPIFNCVRKC
jgi:hypothetical protein